MIIYKYPLIGEVTELSMLPGAQVLDVQYQHGALVLWARAEQSKSRSKRWFYTRPTGHEYTDTLIGNEKYIATVQDPNSNLVWHIFEGGKP